MDDIIEATNKLYRITLFFPKKEPLRYKIRETADSILSDLTDWEVFKKMSANGFMPVENSDDKKKKEQDLIFNIEKDFETLKNYFEIAKWQNWVSYFDILELEEQYDNIKIEAYSGLPKISLLKTEDKITPLPEPESLDIKEKFIENLDFRKERILSLLKEKGRLQVWEVSKVFPEVSKRTLRRDFVQLLELGLIERIGQRNETFYKLKS